jgi:hypothetical protein
VRSLFIDRRTRSERAVAVEVSEREGAVQADVDAVEGVRGSGPLHEHRRRRRPGVLDVDELAILIAHDEVQVACERHERCGDKFLSIDGRGLRVPSLSRSENTGWVQVPTSMASKGFALPVRCTNTGAVDVPVFSM